MPRTLVSRNIVHRPVNDNRHNKLIVWACGCLHCAADKAQGRNSFTEALTEIESAAYGIDPDVAIITGDFGANQGPMSLAVGQDLLDGADVALQLGSGTRLTRNKIYTLRGNHDAGTNGYGWYDRYIDLLGANTAFSGVNNSLRPYPINGTAERYPIVIGNVLFLCISDKNDAQYPCGFHDSVVAGGHPSGSVSEEVYNWWVAQIEANPTKNIITCAHNLLKDTTIATGDNEGVDGGYHGSSGQAIGSGRLHNIVIDSVAYEADQTRFKDYLTAHPGCIAAWIGAHTHYKRNETYNGRGWTVTKYGTTHFSLGGLTRYHDNGDIHPQSAKIEFVNGSNKMTITKFHHGGFHSVGLDNENIVEITLPFAFQLN